MPHRFTSHDPDHPPQPPATVLRWAVLDRLLGRRQIADPGPGAPWQRPDLDLLRTPATSPRLTFIGHASFLLQMAGRNVLLDPVMCRRLATYTRHVPSGLDPEQLPGLDLLLISHGHYDHLDVPTLRRLPKDAAVGVPLGLGDLVRAQGFADVRELDWWQSLEHDGLRATLVPARHWHRRHLFDLNDALWGGWVIEPATSAADPGGKGLGGQEDLEGRGGRVYYAGDSAYFDGFRDIGARFPDLDLAILPVGAYAPAWFMERQHMNPEQAGQAFLDLGASVFVPCHWGTFQLTDESLTEPVERLAAWWRSTQPEGTLKILAVGETLGD